MRVWVGGFSRLGASGCACLGESGESLSSLGESGCVSGCLWVRVLSLGESGCARRVWVRASGESLSSLGARESYLCTSPNDSPTWEPREAAVTPGLLPAERMESGLCERGVHK
jgi:hypothetical protein